MSGPPESAQGFHEAFGQNANQTANHFAALNNHALPYSFWTQLQNGTSSTDGAPMLPPPVPRNGVPIPPPSFVSPAPSYPTNASHTTRGGMSIISTRQKRAAADSPPRIYRHNIGRYGAEREEGELSDAELPLKGINRTSSKSASPHGGGESYRANGELPIGRAGLHSENSIDRRQPLQNNTRGTKGPPKQPRNFNRGRPVPPRGSQLPSSYENYQPAPEPVSPQIDESDLRSAKPRSSNTASTTQPRAPPMVVMPLPKQDDPSSLLEQRKQAKKFVQLMYQNNFTFDQLKHEGLDPVRLRRLYEEAGLPVPSRRSEFLSENPASVSVTSSAQTNPSVVPPAKINATVPHGKKAEILDRKEYIARLIAAKTSKPVTSTISSKPPSAAPVVAEPTRQTSSPPNRMTDPSNESTSQIKIGKLSEQSKQEGQAATAPTHDSQSLVSAAKKKAQTELARQKMDALNAARFASAVKETGNGTGDGSVIRISRTAESGTTATEHKAPSSTAEAPQLRLSPGSPATKTVSMFAGPHKTANVAQTMFPDIPPSERPPSMPAQPNLPGLGQFNNVIPGLFMTASAPQQASPLDVIPSEPPMRQPNTAPVKTDPSIVQTKQAAINSRKRPVASDFQDDYSSKAASAFKRRFGQARYEAFPEKIVINASDDEDPSSDENESMKETSEQFAFGSVIARAREPAVRDLPPLTNLPSQTIPRAKPGSVSSSVLNTPGAVTPGLARDLEQVKRKEEEISLMKRKIAELEQRQKVRVVSSRPHTPVATQATDSAASSVLISLTNLNSASLGAEESSKVAEFAVNEMTSPAVHETMEVSSAAAAISSTGVRLAEDETTIRKKKRRAEIQSNLPALDASMASSKAKLEQLKSEMAMLEAAMQKEMQDKEALIQEMGSLGIDTEGMDHSELKATKKELIREQNIHAGAVSDKYDSIEESALTWPQTGLADQEANSSAASTPESPNAPAHAVMNSIASENAPTLTKDGSAEPHAHTSTHEAHVFNQIRAMHENSPEDAMDISDDSSADSGEVANGPHPMSAKSSEDYNVLHSPVPLSPASMESPVDNARDSLTDADMEDYYTADPAQLAPSEPRRSRSDKISSAEVSVQREVARDATGTSTATSPAENGRMKVNGLSSTQRQDLMDGDIQQHRNFAPLKHTRTNVPDGDPVADQTPFHSEIQQTSTLTDSIANPTVDNLGRDIRSSKTSSQEAVRRLIPGSTGTSLTMDDRGHSNIRHHYFTPYISPLTIFKGYRYHPDYSKDVPGGFRSMTYSHDIDPNIPICMFEAAGGTCNDKQCSSQHFRKMSLSDDMVLVQLGTANPGRTEEERAQWTKGLRAVLNNLRSRKIKDPEDVAAQITDYRRKFLNDPSKILNL